MIEVVCSKIQQSIFGAPSQAGCVRPILSEGKKYFVEYRSIHHQINKALAAQRPPHSPKRNN